MKQNAIQPANLEFNAEGTPVSRDFDDVYFSNDNGLEETRYVFLDGNQLNARFPTHPRSLFVVAESGFGTGLNFLTLWQMFDQFHAAHPDATLQRLHFISFENFRSPRMTFVWPINTGRNLRHGRSSFRRSGRRTSAAVIVCCWTAGASRWICGSATSMI